MASPHDVEQSHILAAIEEIDRPGSDSIPRQRRMRKFEVRFGSGSYPPKYPIARSFHIWNASGATAKELGLEPMSSNEESAFAEGKVIYRKHRRFERDQRIVRLAKAKRLHEANELIYDVCKFSFPRFYGNLGIGFIEANHTEPVSELKAKRKTKISEIALVCSNCHRCICGTR